MADIEHIFPPYMKSIRAKPTTSRENAPLIMAKAQHSMPTVKATEIPVIHTR